MTTNPSINAVNTAKAAESQYMYPNGLTGLTMANPLYNSSIFDMESSLATGGYPSSYISSGLDYDLFNSTGYGSPYSGIGYGGYVVSPAMMQAMVQSQTLYMDAQNVLNKKKHEINYNDKVDSMYYDTKLKDATDDNTEDSKRRDVNINNICRQINESLENKDTKRFLEAYNEGLELYAKVYNSVNDKRSSETPSQRSAIKAAFAEKYKEVTGGSLQEKIDNCLPGAIGSGFATLWNMQEVKSAEEVKAIIDDRDISYKDRNDIGKAFGSVLGGLANIGVTVAAGTAAGGVVGAAGGAVAGMFGKGSVLKTVGKFGIRGAAIAGIGSILVGIYRCFKSK